MKMFTRSATAGVLTAMLALSACGIFLSHMLSTMLCAVLAAGAASLAGYLPMGLPLDISVDAIDSLLSVLSSSMLAVTTFSIGSLMTAYGSATSNGTPRATTLLAEDPVVQSALATFVGSFLFSIVGMVALRISAYGPEGRALLFLVTLAVIGLVVQALLRWIDQLTRLGRVGDTLERIEEATHEAMTVWLDHPSMDGRPRPDAPPPGQPVPAGRVGYIQHVDVAALDLAGTTRQIGTAALQDAGGVARAGAAGHTGSADIEKTFFCSKTSNGTADHTETKSKDLASDDGWQIAGGCA